MMTLGIHNFKKEKSFEIKKKRRKKERNVHFVIPIAIKETEWKPLAKRRENPSNAMFSCELLKMASAAKKY